MTHGFHLECSSDHCQDFTVLGFLRPWSEALWESDPLAMSTVSMSCGNLEGQGYIYISSGEVEKSYLEAEQGGNLGLLPLSSATSDPSLPLVGCHGNLVLRRCFSMMIMMMMIMMKLMAPWQKALCLSI